mmetsp:Transcript_96972/g.274284  ORF Transcript_96972/g.274284 Transcript_96972/m.274284 type:complete len:302 (-) Transcript_96972:153-1058(-)
MATQFTPQQLTGGPKYNHKVKIGNWSEDLEMEEIKLKDYLSKKDTGSLIVTAKQKQLEGSLVPVELSPSPEGCLQFGMKVMLYNHQTAGVLGANPFDAASKAYGAWMATTGPMTDPVVRNVFELESTDGSDGVVLYGQTIRLKLHPFAKITSPAYLQSEMVTPVSAAKFSRYQEVLVISEPAGDTKWQIHHPDPDLRAETEGEEVPAGRPVLIRHVQTGTYLASDKIPYKNMFGQECEVHCHSHVPLSKGGVLAGEAKGETENSIKPMGLPNTWTIVTSTDGAAQGGPGLDLTGLPAEGGM